MDQTLLNTQILMVWQEVDEDNWKGIVSELTRVFFDASIIQMKQLRAAWITGDLQQLGRAAHSLKSSCGNVGATKAQAIFERIETACHSKNKDVVQALVQELEPIFQESRKQLKEFLDKIQAA